MEVWSNQANHSNIKTHTTILLLKYKIQTSVHTNCVHSQESKVINIFSGGQFDNLYQNNKQDQKLLMNQNLGIYLREVIIDIHLDLTKKKFLAVCFTVKTVL